MQGVPRHAAALAAGLLAITVAAPTHATTPAPTRASRCTLSYPAKHLFVWTGADSHNWNNPANWQSESGTYPGRSATTHDSPDFLADVRDFVCIPSGSVQLARNGAKRAVAAIDVAPTATLTLSGGTALFVNNDANSHRSAFERGSKVTLSSSTLGGTGTVQAAGTVKMTHNSAFTTRWCAMESAVDDPHRKVRFYPELAASCKSVPERPPHPGTLRITKQGELLLTGAPHGGLNLDDDRIIDNDGAIRIANAGYIAASDGTQISNGPHGRIILAGVGGIYEGFVHRHRGLARLPNAGVLRKQSSTAASVVSIAYHKQPGGHVAVTSGSLSVGATATPSAEVSQGNTFGTGSCRAVDGNAPCPSPVPSGTSQFATATVPANVGTARVSVTVSKDAAAPAGSDAAIDLDKNGTRAHPLQLTLAYRATAAGSYNRVAVDTGSGFHRIPKCPPNTTTVPTGNRACSEAPTPRKVATGGTTIDLTVFKVRSIIANGRWIIR